MKQAREYFFKIFIKILLNHVHYKQQQIKYSFNIFYSFLYLVFSLFSSWPAELIRAWIHLTWLDQGSLLQGSSGSSRSTSWLEDSAASLAARGSAETSSGRSGNLPASTVLRHGQGKDSKVGEDEEEGKDDSLKQFKIFY